MSSRLPRDRKSTRLNSSHTVIYTLSLHDALPICLVLRLGKLREKLFDAVSLGLPRMDHIDVDVIAIAKRSEEHTSELQSHRDLHSFPTRRSSDLSCSAPWQIARKAVRRGKSGSAPDGSH